MTVWYLDQATAVPLHLFCRCFALLRYFTLKGRVCEVKECKPGKIALLFVVAFFSEEEEHFIVFTLVKEVVEIGLFLCSAQFPPLHRVRNWEAVYLHEGIAFILPKRYLSELLCSKLLLVFLLNLSILGSFDLNRVLL